MNSKSAHVILSSTSPSIITKKAVRAARNFKAINHNYCLRTFLVLCKYLNMSASVSLDKMPHTTSRMKSDMMASVARISCSVEERMKMSTSKNIELWIPRQASGTVYCSQKGREEGKGV